MGSSWRSSLVVVAIAATVFLTGLGAARLWDEDEPKNSVCGQEMFARGDWIVPTFNGDLRTAAAKGANIDFSYQSSARALAVLERKPSRLEIDGIAVNPQMQGPTLLLPKGQHLVTLQ